MNAKRVSRFFPGLGQVGGVPVRDPYAGELGFFQQNPHVAGMAGEDNRVMLNPYSSLPRNALSRVLINEAARVHMRKSPPSVELTDEQKRNLAGTTYATAPRQAQIDTIIARLLSGDPSGGQATPEQANYLALLQRSMFQGPGC